MDCCGGQEGGGRFHGGRFPCRVCLQISEADTEGWVREEGWVVQGAVESPQNGALKNKNKKRKKERNFLKKQIFFFFF